jgi:hypothetical protein
MLAACFRLNSLCFAAALRIVERTIGISQSDIPSSMNPHPCQKSGMAFVRPDRHFAFVRERGAGSKMIEPSH